MPPGLSFFLFLGDMGDFCRNLSAWQCRFREGGRQPAPSMRSAGGTTDPMGRDSRLAARRQDRADGPGSDREHREEKRRSSDDLSGYF